MKHFETLTEAMEDLRGRGYTHEFAPQKDFLVEKSTETKLKGEEFTVDEFYRFEGASDPGDEMTLYAITTDAGLKGVFVSAQGTYANEVSPELMAKFRLTDRPNVNMSGSVEPINQVSTNQ